MYTKRSAVLHFEAAETVLSWVIEAQPLPSCAVRLRKAFPTYRRENPERVFLRSPAKHMLDTARTALVTLNAKYIHSSLALRYLKSYCGGEFPGLFVREFTINERPPDIAGEIYRLGAEVVAFSCCIWNIRQTLEVAAILKKVSPRTLIVLGGPEVSFDAADFLAANRCVDFIVMGEGEETFKELLRTLAHERGGPDAHDADFFAALARIAGLCYRDAYGVARENPPRPLLAPLDALPSPYADLAADAGLDPVNRYVYYECSRGCPFACQFCLSSTTAGVRFFSLDRVKYDLTRLIEAGAWQIKFVDRTFNANRRFALAVWRFLIEKAQERLRHGQPAPRFYFEIGADLLDGDDEVLGFLGTVPAGLFQFEIGVQTADDRVNALIGRRQNFACLSRVVRRLADPGNIRLHLDLIAALPTEGYAAFGNSFNAVAGLGAHELQLGFLKLLKGTKLRRRASEFGYAWVDVPPYQVLKSDALSYEELLRLERIEDLVDRYWNGHLADEALAYLTERAFPSALGMWETFAAHWVEKGLHRREHSRAGLYEELAAFGEGVCVREEGTAAEVFRQLLKFGWLRQNQSRQLPAWCPPSEFSDEEKEELWGRLAERNSRLSRRYGILEAFPFNPLAVEAPIPVSRRTVMHFFYGSPGERRLPAEVTEVAL